MLPALGVSAIDREGQAFCDVAARDALFRAIRETAEGVEIVELDCHINDPQFADAAVAKLLKMLRGRPQDLVSTLHLP